MAVCVKRTGRRVAPAADRNPDDAKVAGANGRVAHHPRGLRDVVIFVQRRQVINGRARTVEGRVGR